MADEPKTPRRRSPAKDTADKASEKPVRTRATAKKPAEVPAEKAPRTRAGAKPAAEKAGADEPARTRAAAKKTGELAAAKPSRTRAKAPSAELVAPTPTDTPAAETPKRTRQSSRRMPAETAAAPKPSRTRRARPVGPVTVRAQARYVRSSARKARLVCDHIRGKSVPEARALLAFAPRGVARDWAKLLDSAVANAENNHELIGDELRVKVVYADEGPTLKRFRPRAMGRATPIHKRTSHLTIMIGTEE
jgi:ribosomal protein L22